MNLLGLQNDHSKYANRQMEIAQFHLDAQRQLTTLSAEWCWRRDLGAHATRRAFAALRKRQ